MDTARRARIASLLRHELAVICPREVKDPRVGNITITAVEVSADGKAARVYLTARGSSAEIDSSVEGLRSAAPHIRRCLARTARLRNIPQLTFLRDKGIENSLRVQELLKRIEDEGTQRHAADQQA